MPAANVQPANRPWVRDGADRRAKTLSIEAGPR